MILNGYALQEAMKTLTIKNSDSEQVKQLKASPEHVRHAKAFLALRAELGLVYPTPPPPQSKR